MQDVVKEEASLPRTSAELALTPSGWSKDRGYHMQSANKLYCPHSHFQGQTFKTIVFLGTRDTALPLTKYVALGKVSLHCTQEGAGNSPYLKGIPWVSLEHTARSRGSPQ